MLDRKFPLEQLRPVAEPYGTRVWEQHLSMPAEQVVYEVNRLLDHRRNKRTGQDEFYVDWLGFPTAFRSWQPSADIASQVLIDDLTSGRHGDRTSAVWRSHRPRRGAVRAARVAVC